MYRDHSVGVVIPAYNEAEFIGEVIDEMPAYVDTIYVVDDCSTDGTWDEILTAADADHEARIIEVAEDKLTSEPVADGGSTCLEQRAVVHDPIGRVIPIQHRTNRGAGGSIKTGYLAALADEVDIVSTVDGDGQMDLSQLSRLLDPIVDGTVDNAKGNRLLYEEYRSEMPAFRLFGNSILTFMTKIASGYWKTMDPQNGYTAISYDALSTIGIENMYEYYGYCNDLLVKLNARSIRIADVAIPAVYGDEESSITYSTYIRKVSGMLMRNFLWRLKVKYLVFDFHPLVLFYVFGVATSTVGVMGIGWSIYTFIRYADPLFVRGSIGLLLSLMGCLFVLFAALFDMQTNECLEVQVHG